MDLSESIANLTIVVSTVALAAFSLEAIAINIFLLVCICRYKEMLIKRNMFIMNLCLFYLFYELLMVAIFLLILTDNINHLAYFLTNILGILPNVQGLLIILFCTGFVYGNLGTRGVALCSICVWTLGVIQVTAHYFACPPAEECPQIVYLFSFYLSWILTILVIVLFVTNSGIWIYKKCNKLEVTKDFRIRMILMALCVFFIIKDFILDFMIVRGFILPHHKYATTIMEVIILVVAIMNLDDIFKEVIKSTFCCNSRFSRKIIRYNSLESDAV